MPTPPSKLLIVDDEPSTRLLLSQIFSGMGLDVVCAEDGVAALEQIRRETPDIILSDLQMPRMSGFEFLSLVRRDLPSAYVIATSGSFTGLAVPEGIAADAFYQKATGLANLFRMVAAAREAARSTDDEEDLLQNTKAPIWISLDRDHELDDRSLDISCPHCLRVFTLPHHVASGAFQQHHCSLCGSPVRFAVVKVLTKGPSGLSQQDEDAQLATHPRSRSLNEEIERSLMDAQANA